MITSTERDELLGVVRKIKGFIKAEKEFGIDELILKQPGKPGFIEEAGRERLEDLSKKVLSCKRCGLHDTRTKVVFGQGSKNAKLFFVGEAPGFEEDRQGIPFVGRAGELLTRIIQSIGLKRKNVYIGNILKCRPPSNRNPAPDEIKACYPYLMKQLEIIRPRVICALGKFAAQTLLDTTKPISRLRGEFHTWNGIKVMPTFHPAYLLRNPSGKREVWEDMKKIRNEISKITD
ncbi:MAG: uracil-DNA glycosylase [Candidatus Omnitrophota bacterium]|nr:uracil-DNA glycosylase [Candidatus Omnitrophota bacterium]